MRDRILEIINEYKKALGCDPYIIVLNRANYHKLWNETEGEAIRQFNREFSFDSHLHETMYIPPQDLKLFGVIIKYDNELGDKAYCYSKDQWDNLQIQLEKLKKGMTASLKLLSKKSFNVD